MGIGTHGAYRKLHLCFKNPFGVKSWEQNMPAVVGVGVYVGVVEIRDPVTPSGTTTEQAAAEILLTLVFPP